MSYSNDMSLVGNNTPTINNTQWNEKEHYSVTNFFHALCPRLTEDATKVYQDIGQGISTISSMASHGKSCIEDIISAVKKEKGFLPALQKALQMIGEGKNPLTEAIKPEHLKGLKDDFSNLKSNIQQLRQDSIPLSQDLLQVAGKAKDALAQLMDIARIARDILQGHKDSHSFEQLIKDARLAFNDIKAITHA
ncbi:hypothetical protein [Dongshaea marina]|uniref:hypothetical protein n=1 Tax=Dongshaea marina TaxID=2047966 RepID=UPI000D3ECA20|nr:hypothetical protein [Dongshaea marina]